MTIWASGIFTSVSPFLRQANPTNSHLWASGIY